MTRADMLVTLSLMATHQAGIHELEKRTGLFCIGTLDRPEIHIGTSHWGEVIETIKPTTVTYNPLFSNAFTEAYFKMRLNGSVYKIFTLFAKEA